MAEEKTTEYLRTFLDVTQAIFSSLSLKEILKIGEEDSKRVIGILRLYSQEMRQYTGAEVAFLTGAAELAGVAIMNAKLYEKTKYDLSFWMTTLEYLDARDT